MPSPAATGRPDRRDPGIDLVRGVAILLVVTQHTAIRIPPGPSGLAAVLPRRLLSGISSDGYEAVFAFFVVSGFLIAGNAIRRWGSLGAIDLRAFYRRRAARILPCLLLLLFVLSALWLAGAPHSTPERSGQTPERSGQTPERSGQTLGRALLAALTLRLNWYEGQTGYLPAGWDVLWSLSIEEAFYLGFPLLCLGLGRWPRLLAAGFGLLALSMPLQLRLLGGAPEIWREKAYGPGLAAIAAGVCAALLVARVPAPRPGRVAAAGWAALAALGGLFWWEDVAFRWLGSAGLLLLTGNVALLSAAFGWGWGRRGAARGTAWLRSFGVMSYEIYLSHMAVVFAVADLLRWADPGPRWRWPWFVPVMALCWGLGWAVERGVSRPAGRRLRGRNREERAA